MDYKSFVNEYIKQGLLKKQKTDWAAIKKLMRRCYIDLSAADSNLAIDEGIAFSIAYMAMLRAARAYMLCKGLRPADGFQHKTVVEFLEHSLRIKNRQILSRFDMMRRKRNIFSYEIGTPISRTEAELALKTAGDFVALICDILMEEDPQFKLKIKDKDSK